MFLRETFQRVIVGALLIFLDYSTCEAVIFAGPSLAEHHEAEIVAVLERLGNGFVHGQLVEPGVVGELARRVHYLALIVFQELQLRQSHLFLVNREQFGPSAAV